MATNVQLDLNDPLIKDWIYCKTNVGGWFFDAFLRVDYEETLSIADHPVAQGADITDHAYQEPKVIIMEIGMSDAKQSFIPGQFTQSWSRSSSAYKILQQLQQERIPIQLLTRLGLYQNMLIESIVANDDYSTLFAGRYTITFREIIVATIQNVKIIQTIPPTSNNAANASTTAPAVKNGSVQPTQTTVPEDKTSALYNITGRIF